MTANLVHPESLPDWVPAAVRLYLDHTAGGHSLREIARREGVHASTVLRQVRRFESRRDDPLVDCALGRLQQAPSAVVPDPACAQDPEMSPNVRAPALPFGTAPGDGALLTEARRLLPLLAGPDVVLVVASDMDRAVVLRDGPGGSERLAVLDRPVAEAFALRDWIVCRKAGRVAQYVLTPEGRGMLRKLDPSPTRPRAADRDEDAEGRFRPPPESPVALLARRRDPDGRPFLPPRLVAAAERLSEDFEIAQIEPRATQDWERVLTGAIDGGSTAAPIPGATPAAARARVLAALADLGPGLGDVALRCCCWQEGVETAERRLGWAARSGKIVLRIALERLARHYAAQGEAAKMIG